MELGPGCREGAVPVLPHPAQSGSPPWLLWDPCKEGGGGSLPPLSLPADALRWAGPSPRALCWSLAGSLQAGDHWTLSFDMTSISSSHEVRLAELRVRLPSFPQSHNVTVDLYHSHESKRPGNQTCVDRLFLGTFTSSPVASHSSWTVFNVTSLLQSWLHQGMNSNKPSAEPSRASTLIRTAETSKHIMIDNAPKELGNRRHRRNKQERQRIKMADLSTPGLGEEGRSLCKRVDMIVNFEQTGWGSWIVYPKKYNAYRCEGECPAPVDESFKPTNHAYIQSLLKLYQPNRVPCPACAPVKMSPLSMLYYEKGEVVLRHHEDMIIEECGCN
uniref:TGF-beta family profile domain-containing protein n=1 Tax=Chelydra serpentina TaxID=8475 RepID=A0A8C3TE83_CHESE